MIKSLIILFVIVGLGCPYWVYLFWGVDLFLSIYNGVISFRWFLEKLSRLKSDLSIFKNDVLHTDNLPPCGGCQLKDSPCRSLNCQYNKRL